MGKYINETSKGVISIQSVVGKIAAIRDDGGTIIPEPKEWCPNLVCVFKMGIWAYACYVDTAEKMLEIKYYPEDDREKIWMLW